VIGLWAFPKSEGSQYQNKLLNIRTKIDWGGAGIASVFMALLCYLLA